MCIMSHTGVDPNTNCKTVSWHMADFEELDGAQKMQSHRAYLQSVFIAVADR